MDQKGNKITPEEAVGRYVRFHRETLAQQKEDRLDAVIHHGADVWTNRFTDYAHRLGMRKVFAYLERRYGSLENLSVLDAGCGRGRWVQAYGARGARVTGVDVSPEAIETLAGEMPQHRFLCQDLTRLEVPPKQFDVVNSVTVVQHLLEESQGPVLRRLADCLKDGGFLVLLENSSDFDAWHVFPHTREEWRNLGEAAGLQYCVSWGSNYEVLIRSLARLSRLARRRAEYPPTAPDEGEVVTSGSGGSRVKRAVKNLVALVSFPVERLCHLLPVARPTHWVMIFVKPSGPD